MPLRTLITLLLMTLTITVSFSRVSLPYYAETTTDLNVRTGPSKDYSRITTLRKGAEVKVVRVANDKWVEVEYNYNNGYARKGYVSHSYLRYTRKAESPVTSSTQTKPTKKSSSSFDFSIWSLLGWGISIYFGIALLYWILKILQVGLIIVAYVFTKVFQLLSLPFFLTNAIQRYAAKPWMPFFKSNHFSDSTNASLREWMVIAKIPLYIILFPLRLGNALFFNMTVHCLFEMFNYCVEVVFPIDSDEGRGNVVKWIYMLPVRIVKYPVWHGALTIIESAIWTIIDTLVPALTVFHGTSPEAADCIVGRPNHGLRFGYKMGIWNVGGGNYAGDGIYFAPARSTAIHYAQGGSVIVCRVTFGKTLDLGIAPKYVYNQCGKPNAHGVTKWGLDNGYVTGEWWRKREFYNGDWWEYCMYDWQNRYNVSWRIRPLYVINLSDNYIQRIPGGMSHWLFRKMAIKDLRESIF